MMRSILLGLLICCFGSDVRAQSVTTGVSRDTVRVGDPVRVLIRIDNIPANAEVILPDSLATIDDVENGGRVRMRRDTIGGGATRITAAYPVILWRPGEIALPTVPMVVRMNGSERTHVVTLPVLNVMSVLPADTTNIQAKPPKDVWGADRVWWPWLVALAVLLLLAALAYWWYRKRRAAQTEVEIVPFVDPRERALQEIKRIRELQLIEQAQYKRHYILLSDVLRSFAASLESDWSTDLTTDELAPRLKRRSEAAPLMRLLRSADMVKFARRVPAATEARADTDAAEEWVRSFERRAETAEAA